LSSTARWKGLTGIQLLEAREHFEERAAICEYDGEMSRAEAEKIADECTDAFGVGKGWLRKIDNHPF